MSLRANTYVALIGAAFLAIACVFAVTIYAGRAQIHAGERSVAASAMDQVSRALASEQRAMALTAADWGAWDDTYHYVLNRNKAYEESNLNGGLLESIDLDCMILVDPAGSVVAARWGGEFTADGSAKQQILSALKSGGFRSRAFEGTGIQGVLRTGDSATVFVARPVVRTNGAGPAVGVLFIGRYLDERRIADLGEVANVQLVRYTPSDPRLSPQTLADIAEQPAADPIAVEVTRPLDIFGYLRIDDIDGTPAVVLGSRREPLTYAMAMRVLTALIGTFLVGGLIWSLLAFSIVDRTSISRITWLRDEMGTIAQTGVISSRIAVSDALPVDEAHIVAAGVNSMLDALEGSHARIIRSEEHHRVLVESMADAVFTMGEDGRFTFVNAQAEALTGYSRERLTGMHFNELLTSDSVGVVRRMVEAVETGSKAERIETQFVDRGGRIFPVELAISPVCDEKGGLLAVHWIARDVTERKRAEEQLLHMATHDHLTGLFNRRRFEEEIAQHLAETRRHGDGGALLWIDIDKFKEVNDSLGHRAGDEVLGRVAAILIERTRDDHVLARLGGDEFAVLLPRCDADEAVAASERIGNELRNSPVTVDGRTVSLTASIGVALFPGHATTVEELLLHADIAMYRAKEGGRNRVCLYSPDDDWPQQLINRRDWTGRLETAIEQGALVAFAQPIQNVLSGDITGFELLVRMKDENGELLPPGDFLSAAEDIGLITAIDRTMMAEGAALAAALAPGFSDLTIFVNLSAKTLADSAFPRFVRETLDQHGADPHNIGFELTETALVSNLGRAQGLITSLREMGCRFALDDFGAGFSSLNYLRHMPVDILKIDGSLVREMVDSEQDRHLVRAIVDLARCLNICVTAEFVESKAVLECLREMNVESVQGFFIGRPQPVEQLLATVARPGQVSDE